MKPISPIEGVGLESLQSALWWLWAVGEKLDRYCDLPGAVRDFLRDCSSHEVQMNAREVDALISNNTPTPDRSTNGIHVFANMLVRENPIIPDGELWLVETVRGPMVRAPRIVRIGGVGNPKGGSPCP